MQQLVPQDLLAKSDKILILGHFAIGDFVYFQNYLMAFAQQYPHLKIHVWVDEVRRTSCFWRWKNLKKYALYDWLDTCPFIHKLYRETYSPGTLKKSIKEAQNEHYPIVVTVATLRSANYALLAREIGQKSFVVGLKQKTNCFQFLKRWRYKKLDASLCIDQLTLPVGYHVSDTYAQWFERLFGVIVAPSARAPFIQVPRKWITYAKLHFLKYGIDKKTKEFGKVIFINAVAKSKKRDWPLEKVLQLVTALKQDDQWGDVSFLVNVMPEDYHRVRAFFNQHSINNLYLFTAAYNFFQLPAVLSICDLIVSVETSVMHLASALKIPVVALMRTKNPEWVPWDSSRRVIVWADKRNDWVNDIAVDVVLQEIKKAAAQHLF